MPKNILIYFVLLLVPIFSINCTRSNGDQFLGVTWADGVLVTFDPYTGKILKKHVQLPSTAGAIKGLAYDSISNRLYALSGVNWQLYAIDPQSFQINLVGKLNINRKASWGEDIGGLTFDTKNRKLYATVDHWEVGSKPLFGAWSELLEIDPDSAEITVIGKITDGFCITPSYNSSDGQIYAYVVYGGMSCSSHYKSILVRLDPVDATMTELLQTPYRHIAGLAKKPDQNIFITQVNACTGNFYGELNLDTKTVSSLASSDTVGVLYNMIDKGF